MVNWQCQLDSGETISGSTEDGSWKRLKGNIGDKRIVSVVIFSDKGSGKIDNNKDGYFISNKILTAMGKEQIDFVAIGYWNKNESVVRTKWYFKDTMELAYTEARSLESTQDGLISFSK